MIIFNHFTTIFNIINAYLSLVCHSMIYVILGDSASVNEEVLTISFLLTKCIKKVCHKDVNEVVVLQQNLAATRSLVVATPLLVVATPLLSCCYTSPSFCNTVPSCFNMFLQHDIT